MVYTALLIPILAFLERVYAPPTKLYAPLSTSSFVGRASACPDIESGSRRSLWSIINGCLLTIFACTSVSFHPDVPNQTHSPWRIRLIHLNCLLHAFLYPEMMVLKAASQWWRVVEYELPFQGMLHCLRTHVASTFSLSADHLFQRKAGLELTPFSWSWAGFPIPSKVQGRHPAFSMGRRVRWV